MPWNILIFPLLLSFLITLAITPISIIVIKHFGLIDDPKVHKHPAMLHKKPVPRGGGIPLFIGVWGASYVFLPKIPLILGLFIASFIALFIGTLDDKYDISRYIRLGINFLCALIIILSGVGLPFITNPFGGIIHLDMIRIANIPIISILLALLWVVWVMNMLNWSKGVDGQMPGVVAISAFVIGILSLRFPISEELTHVATILSFTITGASLGFLVYNFYPAKLFPGYGATSIYLLLSVVSLISGAKLATAILVMGVPMVDAIFTIVRRILSGRSPFLGDKKHLHHLLLHMGWGQRKIALFYWIVSAILGFIALQLSSSQKLFAIIMLIVIIGGGILLLHIITKKTDEKETF